MADDNRKRYWNDEYVRYWQKRVDEANEPAGDSHVIEKDSKAPPDELYIDLIRELGIPQDGRALEMGCGFGRTIPILYEITTHIDAVDISEAMIEKARENCSQLSGVNFFVSEAEKMPFESERFDRVICFGVFDALYQRDALIEINRVLRVGGKALITGKNDNYLADDVKALIAEENARAKGHPNYFTDIPKLLSTLDVFGFAAVARRFYLCRGDTASNQFTENQPSQFYEYALILEKISNAAKAAGKTEISGPISKTFTEIWSDKI